MPVNRNLPEISRNRAGVNVKGKIPSRMLFYLMVPILLTPASSILLTPAFSIFPIPLHPAPVSPLITALCASHFHAVLHLQTTFIINLIVLYYIIT